MLMKLKAKGYRAFTVVRVEDMVAFHDQLPTILRNLAPLAV